jgi:hypothetical protein
MKSCDTEIPASHEVAAPARIALTAMSTMPTHTHSLASFPCRHACSNLVDNTGYLVACDPWILQSRPMALLYKQVTVTYSAGLHVNADLVRSGCRDFPLDDFEWRTRRAQLNSGHVWHVGLLAVLESRIVH